MATMAPIRVCLAAAALGLTACIGLQGSPTDSGSPSPSAASTRGTSGAGPTPSPTPTDSPKPSPTPFTNQLKSKTSLVVTAILFPGGGATPSDVVAVVKNIGTASVDLAADKWQLCGGSFTYGRFSKGPHSLPPGAQAQVHVNAPANCAETDSNYCPDTPFNLSATKGNLALYKGIDSSADFTRPDRIQEFVEWGEANQGREDEANTAKLWRTDTYVQVASGAASISVKAPGDSGVENWQ